MKHGAIACLAVSVLISAALVTCSLPQHHREELEYRTRFFEALMGLPETEIVLLEPELMDGSCGRVGWKSSVADDGLGIEGPVVWYSLDTGCDPFETALEQMCSLRWKHERLSLDKDQEEAEVAWCVRAYRNKLRDVGRHRSPLPAGS